jgi:hypothetical protein
MAPLRANKLIKAVLRTDMAISPDHVNAGAKLRWNRHNSEVSSKSAKTIKFRFRIQEWPTLNLRVA